MYRTASSLLLALFWLLGGGLMLVSGHAPLGTLLVLTGATLPVVVVDRVFARHEATSGAGPAVSRPGAGLQVSERLQRRDWSWLLLSIAGGAALAVFGLTCRCAVG